MSIIFNDTDVLVPFSFKDIPIRGKILRMHHSVGEIVKNFDIKNHSIVRTFLEVIAFNAIISSNFKFDGIFKLQVNCYDMIIKVILVDIKSNGEIRAFISTNSDSEIIDSKEYSFKELCGDNGYLVFHLDQKLKAPYQAIVSLDGENFSDVVSKWFKNSEQIETYMDIFVDSSTNTTGAIFLQMMPNIYESMESSAENKENFNTIKILTQSISKVEMLNDNLEDILYRLYNQFDVVVYDRMYYKYKCSCSDGKIKDLVSTFDETEIEALKNENGKIEIKCNFCNTIYYC